MLCRRAETGGDQYGAELVTVQRDSVGLVVHPRTADVGGRGVIQEFLFDCVLVDSLN